MDDDTSIFIGSADGKPQRLMLRRANRHGLIAGATGTGKTVTLQGLAEGFSEAGVPVFLEIGRASCRERVQISVVAVSLKKTGHDRAQVGVPRPVPLLHCSAHA